MHYYPFSKHLWELLCLILCWCAEIQRLAKDNATLTPHRTYSLFKKNVFKLDIRKLCGKCFGKEIQGRIIDYIKRASYLYLGGQRRSSAVIIVKICRISKEGDLRSSCQRITSERSWYERMLYLKKHRQFHVLKT